MNTYLKLQKEFENKVEQLQKECPHKRLSIWTEIHWAIGHSTGTSAKFCKRCNLQIIKRYTEGRCLDCNHILSSYISPCDNCKSDNLKRYYVEEDIRTGNKKDLKELESLFNNVNKLRTS